MKSSDLAQVLAYYRDLGIKQLYRRDAPAGTPSLPTRSGAAVATSTAVTPAIGHGSSSHAGFEASPVSPPSTPPPTGTPPPIGTPPQHLPAAGVLAATPGAGVPMRQQPAAAAPHSLTAQPASSPQEAPPAISAAPATDSSPTMFTDIQLPGLYPADDTLDKISADIGDCRRCRLHQGRHNIVFGVGNPETKLVFVGEGPGQDEDLQGIPFVGRAGQLLTAMIENTAQKEGIPLKRSDVYICNVVKCRPPDNRTPEPDEMEICGQFLFRQLAVIRPKAICALGGTAAKALLGRKEGVTKLRGNWYRWTNIPVMVTYHPSYLLRAYNKDAKREAWEDLKKLFHFVYD
jgi:DNA polymerase